MVDYKDKQEAKTQLPLFNLEGRKEGRMIEEVKGAGLDVSNLITNFYGNLSNFYSKKAQ
jgi:hypothetical protein